MTEIGYPKAGTAFFGQDAQYNGNQLAYKNNGDSTVTDLNTHLMWTQEPGSKKTFQQAVAGASKCRVGGYIDWRLPTIKELYSLILFSGTDPDPMSINASDERPFIDTRYFKFQYGNPADGDRIIDSQFATCTKYQSTTMNGNETMFGVNFADGRIKGYPVGRTGRRGEKKFYVLYVRGNHDYGKNDFHDNNDGTITDRATGLMWSKADSAKGMDWQDALAWVQKKNSEKYLGHSDWRLPDAKELQSIVDYTRCPDITNSAAIDPLFDCTQITNEAGRPDYPFYWTSTTHAGVRGGSAAAYVAFGRAAGWMSPRGPTGGQNGRHGGPPPRRGGPPNTFQKSNNTGEYHFLDVHGAGAQRSDPKAGNPTDFPHGRGPQGDVIRIYNFVRCVRG
jgi:hypothetical protein